MFRPVELLAECRAKFGRSFTLRLAGHDFVFVSDRESIQRVFAARENEAHAGKVARLLQVLVGDHSVLVLDGSEHQRQRRLLMPAFHGQRMRAYQRTMADVAERDIATWPRRRAFALLPHFRRVTLEIILRTVFGVEEAEKLEPLANALQRLLRLGDLPFSTLWMGFLSAQPERQDRWYAQNLLRPRRRADALLYEAIRARRAALTDHSAREDVLGMLLAARDEDGSPMSDPEIRDELVTALVAGHETTAITLAWAVQAIASHPEVLARIQSELRERAFVAPDGSLDVERVGDLSYLDAVIKEVLRLRPVISVVGRVLQVPMQIDGREIPPHTIVAPCVYLAHHDPEYYADPEAFRPERFLGHMPEPDIWLPFGGGIRRCIGAAFASVEMKVVLATVLSRTQLELVSKEPPRVVRRAIAFAPRGGVRVRQTG